MSDISEPAVGNDRERRDAVRRVHAAALGYQPNRMKPVHFATSFLLALSGEMHRLEWLNTTAVPRSFPRRPDDPYVAETLLPLLRDEERVGPRIEMREFKALRSHLNAGFNNDGAALNPAFRPYNSPGSDYSTPALAYLANQSKNHGQSGSFVFQVFQATAEGRALLEGCRAVLQHPPPPLFALGAPLLDAGEPEAWTDDYEAKMGASLSADQLTAIAERMAPQTRALSTLVANLLTLKPAYGLRYLIIGLCSWVFLYMMRRLPTVAEPLLFMDALQGRNGRIRAQSRAAYARQVDRFVRSYRDWREHDLAGAVSDDDWGVFTDADDKGVLRKVLEDHFRDLGLRIGFVQPRAQQARRKHFELQADTLRVLAYSVLSENELITLPAFAQRLQDTWKICVGAHPGDNALLRANGLGPLDADEDLEANALGLRTLLVQLGLAVEPSDGLALCGLHAEEMI